jgi:hyaluronoglucosaminidase
MVAGPDAATLAPLVRVCGTWPPGADQDPELTLATGDALGGSPDALEVVVARLAELAGACRAARDPEPVVAELRPWLAGAPAMAEAGLAAAGLLRAWCAGRPAEELAVPRRDTRHALDAAERHQTTVLRTIVPPFVREVLDRTHTAST